MNYFDPDIRNPEDRVYKYSNEYGVMPYIFFYKLLARKPDGSEEE